MNETNVGGRRGLGALGIALAVGMVVSAVICAGTVKRVKLANQTITVKGYAEKAIKSDRAVWRGSFVVRGQDIVSAYKKIQGDLEDVLKYLEKNGIPRAKVNVSSVRTSISQKQVLNKEGYVQTLNEIVGYELGQTVEIVSEDIVLIERLSKESTSLIREGVEFTSMSPEYFVTKADELKITMIGEATRDAKARAEQIASNSGCRVGIPRSAAQGVFQITPAYSTTIANEGINDTSSIDKSIKAVVTLEYSIR